MSAKERQVSNVSQGGHGVLEEMPDTQPQASGQSLALERRLLARVVEELGKAPIAFTLWDGSEIASPGVKAECHVHIRDRGALWRLVSQPDYQFPELYAQGRIHLEEGLEGVLDVVQRLRRDLPSSIKRRATAALLRPRSGSLAHARENIHSHYDVGNDFYKLWLDRDLVYTCAYFPTAEATLEQALAAKMELVCRKLRLQPGERVVEAGCGWGALAMYMARHYGVKVRAFNISKAQLELARERAQREGLSAAVEFIDGDYREIDSQCDAFVSVGMLEHVGPKQYPELGRVMRRCLPANGRGLIHNIGTDRPGRMNPWIERRIFPGAYSPSLEQMMTLFAPYGFSVLDVENLRLHYSLTLRHWLQRFEAAQDKVLEMFDPVFVRAWRFYLASSEASFNAGILQLYQVLFAGRGCNDIAWTRSHLYQDGSL